MTQKTKELKDQRTAKSMPTCISYAGLEKAEDILNLVAVPKSLTAMSGMKVQLRTDLSQR